MRAPVALMVMLGIVPSLAAEAPGKIVGTVVDQQTRTLVTGAGVFLDGSDTGVVSSSDGLFRLTDVAEGSHRLAVVADGYDAASGIVVEVTSGTVTSVEVELVPFTIVTVVTATRDDTLAGIEDTISSNRVRPEEVRESAGAMEDVNKVLQTMPGVVTESDLAGAMYVRGGDALETLTFLDRAFLWNPYHLGGFSSLFSPNLIEKVDFYAGGFPARYPNALSAVVDVSYRDGEPGPISGMLDVSTVDAAVLAEGSVTSRSTFIAEARRTYYDLVIDNFDGNAVPFYDSYYGRFTVNPRVGRTFTTSLLVSRDGLELSGVSDDGDWRNGFSVNPDDDEAGTLFFGSDRILAHASYTELFGDDLLWDTTVSYLDEKTRSSIQGRDPFAFNVDTRNVFLFSDLSKKLSESQLLELGIQYASFDFDIDSVIGDFRSSVPGGRTTAQGDLEKVPIDVQRRPNYWGAYVQHRFEPEGPFELRAGLRGDYWSETDILSASPRLDLRWHASARTSLRLAWGIFHQIPTNVMQTLPGFGNPRLEQERSTHYVLGLKQGLPAGSLLRAEIYWKKLENLVVNPDTEEEVIRRIPTGTTFTNDGTGRSYGFELFLQREAGRFTGWLTYGYAVTRRRNPLHLENPQWYYPLQDQRHTVSCVATLHLGEKWTLGGKAQYGSGKPDTAVVGWELSEIGDPPEPIWIAEYGDLNGDRYPTYFKLDLRVERKVSVFGREGRVHLDVLNVTNRDNLYIYSYDAGDPPDARPSRHAVNSMPFLPYLGLEIQF